MTSTITSTQDYKQISSVVLYRLRNYVDLKAIIKEMLAIYDKKTLLQMYHEAISELYTCYINLMQRDKSKMFMHRFDQYLLPS